MGDIVAESMLGKGAFRAKIRMIRADQSDVNGVKRQILGGIMFDSTDKQEMPFWELMDCEVIIKPIRKEPFRGSKGGTVNDCLMDKHFSEPFGQCIEVGEGCAQDACYE